MALATKKDAERELQSAELKISNFLVSVNNSGIYVPLNNAKSIQQEIDRFANADWERKEELVRDYKDLYHFSPLTQEQKDMLAEANKSILIAKLVNLGVPTKIMTEQEVKHNAEQAAYQKETSELIGKLRNTKNFDKCEHKGQSLSQFLAKMQFSPTYQYTKNDYHTVKNHYDSLLRYNEAQEIIAELDKKAFIGNYQKDFAYKVAQTIKESKGTCSEKQLGILKEAHKKYVGKTGVQVDIPMYMIEKSKERKTQGKEIER